MTDAAGGAGSDPWARASRPLRIAVRAARRTSARAVGEVVDGAFAGLALRGPARVRRLGPGTGRRDYLVELDARDSIGSPGYASAAWELVHRLQDTGTFTLVEADVPVPAYAGPTMASAHSGARIARPTRCPGRGTGLWRRCG